MDLLSALGVIRSATTESLEKHHQEVLETLEDLRRRLSPFLGNHARRESVESDHSVYSAHSSDQLSPTSESESESRTESCESSTSDSHVYGETESDTSTGHASGIGMPTGSISHSSCQPSQWPMKLLATVADDIRWLYDYSREGSTTAAIRNKRNKTTDERINDILRVEGKRGRPSNEDKIFRALAQRSMGTQFTEIQRENKNPKLQTRVDELVESICSSDHELRKRIHKRSNLISKHLHRFDHDPDDRNILSRGINAGFKRLVVERLFAQRLEGSGRPTEPIGISAFTALGVTAFDRLLYEDIPYFLDELFSCEVELPLNSSQGGLRTEAVQLPDALVALSSWFNKLQTDYDGDIKPHATSMGNAALQDEQRSRKRHCRPRVDAALLYQPVESFASRYNNADVGGRPVPCNAGSSTQSTQQIVNASTEATVTLPEVSAMSESRLPTDRPCSLGNWDRDYGVLSMQTVQVPPTVSVWGNRDRVHRDVTSSSMNKQRSLTGFNSWGNWDQDYDIASIGTEQTTSLTFPYGNWDQNHGTVSSELQEQHHVPRGNWDQEYAAASPGVERTASSFTEANWDKHASRAVVSDSLEQSRVTHSQLWGNWDQDYGAPSGPSWTSSVPILMSLQV
ncbi:hypothetical protein AtubIFM55763_011630 [Aspergillus tubingensis]|nr:hypothetical protein AtubIFM55763_011630 [Aspergillus tubingensis]